MPQVAKVALGALLAGALTLSGCGGGGGGSGNNSGGTNPTPTPTPTPTTSLFPAPVAVAAPTPGPVPATQMSAALTAQFAATEQLWDDLHPFSAQLAGKGQYAHRYGEYASDAYYAGLDAWASDAEARLAAIDRSTLNTVERVAIDTLAWRVSVVRGRLQPANRAFEQALAINHMTGALAFYPNYASGNGALPFDDLDDYEDNITRTREYAGELDNIIAALAAGAAAGIVESRVTIDIVIAQIDGVLTGDPTASPFYQPVTNFPAGVPSSEHARLRDEYRQLVQNDVDPALRRLRTYLANTYRPVARTTPGLAALPGGRDYYNFLIGASTSLNLSAAEVHQIGLAATQDILDRMDQIRRADGFSGSLDAFDSNLSSRPELRVGSRNELVRLYRAIGTEVDRRIGDLFLYAPASELVIEPYDSVEEQFIFAATYTPGTADGTRPGLFQFNASQLGGHQLATYSLYLHEGVPGHHYQIMFAREDAGLPWFMQQTGLTAFVEGWALYSETLGYDLNLYEDRLIEYGHLRLQLLRSLRLVVDTGIHDMGWSRAQAIQFMIDNGPYGQGISSEIDRYIAIPSQALGYWLGADKFTTMRSDAEAALGGNFDIRQFHHQAIGTGTVPFPVLEAKIDDWIASQ